MNFKHLFLVVLLLCSATLPAMQGLDEKRADLRNGKSVNLNKEELLRLMGPYQLALLLNEQPIQDIEKKREEEDKTVFVFGGVIGSFVGALCTVAAVRLML